MGLDGNLETGWGGGWAVDELFVQLPRVTVGVRNDEKRPAFHTLGSIHRLQAPRCRRWRKVWDAAALGQAGEGACRRMRKHLPVGDLHTEHCHTATISHSTAVGSATDIRIRNMQGQHSTMHRPQLAAT